MEEKRSFYAQFLRMCLTNGASYKETQAILAQAKQAWDDYLRPSTGPSDMTATETVQAEETAPKAGPTSPVSTSEPETAPESSPTPEQQTPSSEWDPMDSQVMSRYIAEKQDIIRAELLKRGIEAPTSWTGKQLHEKLLELAAPKDESGPVETPQPEVVTDGPPVTLGMIRQKLALLAGPPLNRAEEAGRLISEVGGVSRLTDASTGKQLIPDENLRPLYNALDAAIREAQG
jgi:hypothetical protein